MNILMTIVQATDLDRSLDFYSALGMEEIPGTRGPNWVELAVGDARVALHRTEPGELLSTDGRVVLGFVAESLEEILEAASNRGVEPATAIFDEAYGRSVRFEDPDGLVVFVDEHDAEFHPQSISNT
ncbi:MAG: VOC family protein [Actinobacteria bacterium]|nr:VOC family protein [Actinomycetota bacterium]